MTQRERFVPRRRSCFAILAAASLLTLLFAIAQFRLSRLPFQRDYGEGHVLCLTERILDSHLAYKHLDSLPWVVCPYTPGYMVASRLAGALTGNPLAAGRGLSLISTLGIGVVIGLTILFATAPRFPLLWRLTSAALGGAAPLAAESVLRWASLMRVDMLALFLMYSGLGVYIVLGKRERWQWVAGALFLIALFTKETILSGPLACLLFGLLSCPRKTIRVCAVLAVAGFAGVFWLNAITRGGFLTHIVQYNHNPFSWRYACVQVYQHIHDLLPSVVIGATAVLGVLNPAAIRRGGWRGFLRARCRCEYNRAVLVAGLNAVLAGILMLAIGKVGANVNYFLAWDISSGLLCGLLLFRLLATWETRARGGGRVSVILAALLISTALAPPSELAGALLPNSGRDANARDDAELVRVLRSTPGPVLSENLLAVIQAGKAVEVEPATLTYIANAGRWNERRYIELLEQGYFRALVIDGREAEDFFTPAVAGAIAKNYVLQQKLGRYSIFRPAAATAEIR